MYNTTATAAAAEKTHIANPKRHCHLPVTSNRKASKERSKERKKPPARVNPTRSLGLKFQLEFGTEVLVGRQVDCRYW